MNTTTETLINTSFSNKKLGYTRSKILSKIKKMSETSPHDEVSKHSIYL